MFEHEICFFTPVFCFKVPDSISMELWAAFFHTNNEKAEV